MRVLENKEKLTVDRLTLMRSKLELKMKIEKDKKKKADETHEDRVFISKLLTLQTGLSEVKNQKYTAVLKRKEHLDGEYERELQEKEKELLQKLKETEEKRKRRELELRMTHHSQFESSPKQQSELNESILDTSKLGRYQKSLYNPEEELIAQEKLLQV